MRKLRALLAGIGTVVVARAVFRQRRRIELAGKVVAITGGSRGLGLVLARELVRQGARVAICARDADELERARVELAVIGGTVHASPADVTDRDDITRFLTEVTDELGPIDVLINNAGVIHVGPVDTMTNADYEHALRTHLWAPLHAIQTVLPAMRQRGAGRIVNITSIGAKVAMPHLAPYIASKFALYGLSSAMRAELAGDGIYVTTVVPGLMRTGSPRNATIKGQHQVEYAWFNIADSLPVTSMNAERAARQILRACRYGDAEVVLSLPAKIAAAAHALAPNVVQDAIAMVARLLPHGGSRVGVRGHEAESALAPSVLTTLGDAAARRNNQL